MIVVAMVVYVRVGRSFQYKGEVLLGMGVFVLVLSNINIIWQKSLSAPLKPPTKPFRS